MKAISVKQPWAGLIAMGVKTLEIRSWKTNYRGELLICSSKTPDKNFYSDAMFGVHRSKVRFLTNGVAMCVVDVVGCRPGEKEDEDAAYRDPTGEFVWELENVRLVVQVPVKGKLSFFEVPRVRFLRAGE